MPFVFLKMHWRTEGFCFHCHILDAAQFLWYSYLGASAALPREFTEIIIFKMDNQRMHLNYEPDMNIVFKYI